MSFGPISLTIADNAALVTMVPPSSWSLLRCCDSVVLFIALLWCGVVHLLWWSASACTLISVQFVLKNYCREGFSNPSLFLRRVFKPFPILENSFQILP